MKLTSELRAWLTLFRAHTAILETPMAVLGAALGLGTLWHPEILKWVVFGVLYHYVGYGMNSYVDWKKGFDKDDPRKQHHPLNTGEIKPERAKQVIFGMLVLMILYGEWAAGFSWWAHIAITIMLVSGVAYNYFGKVTDHKYIPISVVHTMVFVFPYFVYSDTVTFEFILATVAFFFHHVYQIMIAGDIKDLDQDEASLIQKWGTEVGKDWRGEEVLRLSFNVYIVSIAVLSVELILALLIYIVQAGLSVYIIVPLFMGTVMLHDGIRVIKPGLFERERRVTAMSRRELWGFWLIFSAFIPQFGIIGWIAVVLASLVYFIPTTRFMWGNWITPEV